MTDDLLAAFLLARIDDTERLARAQDLVRAGDPYSDGSGTAYRDGFPSYPWGAEEGELEFMAGPGHPARVLAECAAKRHIIQLVLGIGIVDGFALDAEVLQTLALPYADHPDYREEWQP